MTATNNQGGNRTNEHQTEDARVQGERLSHKLGESAEQVWLAGLGALGRAQSEGARLFESLVKEGASYQQEGRNRAEAGADALRDQVETRFGQVRGKASENWQKLGRAFDERIRHALHALQVPDRGEVEALRAEVEALKSKLHATDGATCCSDREQQSPPVATSDAPSSSHSPADGQ